MKLLTGMLQEDPKKRLTLTAILRHPWLEQIDSHQEVFTREERAHMEANFKYCHTAQQKDHSKFNREGYRIEAERFEGDAFDDGVLDQHDFRSFCEQFLQSTDDSALRNLSSVSDVVGPFNSMLSRLVSEPSSPSLPSSIEGVPVFKAFEIADVLTFSYKVKQVNKNYEERNNKDIDNGVLLVSPEKRRG